MMKVVSRGSHAAHLSLTVLARALPVSLAQSERIDLDPQQPYLTHQHHHTPGRTAINLERTAKPIRGRWA